MKHFILFLSMITCLGLSAQNDIITKHNGEMIEGRIVRVNEYTVDFCYVNETAENTLSKYAIATIRYGKSGRTEEISPKIIIDDPKKDFSKVIILKKQPIPPG